MRNVSVCAMLTFFARHTSAGSRSSPRFRFFPFDADSASLVCVDTSVEKVRSTSQTDRSTSSPPYANVSEDGDSFQEQSRMGRVALSILLALDVGSTVLRLSAPFDVHHIKL